jgi:hypothetical protein
MIKKYAKIVSEPKKNDNNNEKMMKISFKKKYILNEKIEKQIFKKKTLDVEQQKKISFFFFAKRSVFATKKMNG